MQRASLGLYELCLSTISHFHVFQRGEEGSYIRSHYYSLHLPGLKNRVSSENARKSRAVARLIAPPQVAARHFQRGWKWSALTLQADVSSEDSALMSEEVFLLWLMSTDWLTDLTVPVQRSTLSLFFFFWSICFFLLNIRKKTGRPNDFILGRKIFSQDKFFGFFLIKLN